MDAILNQETLQLNNSKETMENLCQHYKRRCYIIPLCCDKTYPCRLCHDAIETHSLINTDVQKIKCAICDTVQSIDHKCHKCETNFGNYHCAICRLYDDTDKQQFHCDGCGICRVGGRENYYHDEKCGMCYRHGTTHKCVENIALTRCPVCLQDLHTSTIPCVVNKCGHLIHQDCLQILGENMEYKCPVCRKTILSYIADIYKEEIENTIMPPELSQNMVKLSCNDCGKNFEDGFHAIGNICPQCNSVNTARI